MKKLPADALEAARVLAGALLPLGDRYPLPYGSLAAASPPWTEARASEGAQ